MNDLIRLAAQRAAEEFAPKDRRFNSAHFAIEFGKLAGVANPLDGKVVRAMLAGRPDVEVLRGGAHYRLKEST